MGGTVVKEASCQGNQYLFLGRLSTFKMKSASDWYCAADNTLFEVSLLKLAANWENIKWAKLLKISP